MHELLHGAGQVLGQPVTQLQLVYLGLQLLAVVRLLDADSGQVLRCPATVSSIKYFFPYKQLNMFISLYFRFNIFSLFIATCMIRKLTRSIMMRDLFLWNKTCEKVCKIRHKTFSQQKVCTIREKTHS